MAISLIDKIKPKNNGTFALVDAVDVEMPDGKRLSDWKGGGIGEEKTFDLTTLGMGAVTMDGATSALQMDTTTIRAALDEGAIKVIVPVAFGEATVPAAVVLSSVSVGGLYICSCALNLEGQALIFNLIVEDSYVAAYFASLQDDAPATSIDMTKFDSQGQITEIFEDGTAKTTTIEFDADGNPVKITDPDGNVTTLTW